MDAGRVKRPREEEQKPGLPESGRERGGGNTTGHGEVLRRFWGPKTRANATEGGYRERQGG
jgi:hypothetical protein